MKQPIVYAPQLPSKFDPKFQLWVPTMDLSPAKKYGEVKIMLPPNYGSMMGAPLLDAMKERMAEFDKEDYLLAVGDPTLIAGAAGIALFKTGGILKMLKWDRHTRDYIAVEMKL